MPSAASLCEGKEQFLHLVRTNEDMVNDYIVEKKGGP
jgi:hypothetical protein